MIPKMKIPTTLERLFGGSDSFPEITENEGLYDLQNSMLARLIENCHKGDPYYDQSHDKVVMYLGVQSNDITKLIDQWEQTDDLQSKSDFSEEIDFRLAELSIVVNDLYIVDEFEFNLTAMDALQTLHRDTRYDGRGMNIKSNHLERDLRFMDDLGYDPKIRREQESSFSLDSAAHKSGDYKMLMDKNEPNAVAGTWVEQMVASGEWINPLRPHEDVTLVNVVSGFIRNDGNYTNGEVEVFINETLTNQAKGIYSDFSWAVDISADREYIAERATEDYADYEDGDQWRKDYIDSLYADIDESLNTAEVEWNKQREEFASVITMLRRDYPIDFSKDLQAAMISLDEGGFISDRVGFDIRDDKNFLLNDYSHVTLPERDERRKQFERSDKDFYSDTFDFSRPADPKLEPVQAREMNKDKQADKQDDFQLPDLDELDLDEDYPSRENLEDPVHIGEVMPNVLEDLKRRDPNWFEKIEEGERLFDTNFGPNTPNHYQSGDDDLSL